MAELAIEGTSEVLSESDQDSGSVPDQSTSMDSESLQSDSPSVISLFDRLRSPTPADLARKRQLKQNPPPKGVKRGKGKEKGDPKNISATERVKTYPDEEFMVRNSKLFCRACKEVLALKKSSIEYHIKSQKHINGKKKLALKNKEELIILEALHTYDKKVHPVGDGLADSTRVFRVKVVTTMLKAGVPLNKIDLFRDLLEEHGYSLTSSTHLRQLIPFIHQEELSRIKREIYQRPLSIIFDGTTHTCEAFVIVLRYLTDNWELKQCVGRLKLLAKSMTGEEVAQQIIVVLSTELGIPPQSLVAAMRGRASVNDVAMRTIKVVYNQLLDVGCFSHTLDHVGEQMNTPVLHDFCKAWIGLFSRSPKSRLLWRTQTGLSVPSYSATRWWSQFEVIKQMAVSFGDVVKFLKCDDLPPATSTKLLQILEDSAKARKLKIEIAITVDAMEPFVEATYKLEGDGVLSLVTYQQLSMLYAAVSNEHYPNVVAVAKAEAKGNVTHERQLIDYSKACVQPAYDYFLLKFNNDLKPVLDAFKAARLFSPSKFYELKPSVADIDCFKAFPFLNSQLTIDGLKSEIPMYMAASEDVTTDVNPVTWWKSHAMELPKWASAFKLVLLVQPSSSAAERVFSLLQHFTAQQ